MIKNRKLGTICYQTIMWLLLVLCMIPLIWVVRTAFMPTAKALDLFAVAIPTMDNIRHVFETVPFLQYYGNTIFITVLVLGVQLVLVTFAGYAFARLDFYGSRVLFVIFLAQMMIAPEVLILPNYSLMVKLGLNDTRLGIALPFFASRDGNTDRPTDDQDDSDRAGGGCAGRGCILFTDHLACVCPAFETGVCFLWHDFGLLPVEQLPLAARYDGFCRQTSAVPRTCDVCDVL